MSIAIRVSDPADPADPAGADRASSRHPALATDSAAAISPEGIAGLLDAMPDAVVVVDDGGVIVGANAQSRTVFGYDPHELVGCSIEVLVPPRVRPGHPARRRGYARRPMGLLQLSAVRENGEEFPAEISLAPVATSTGVTLTVATVRDISERVRREAEATVEADRMRDELLATITHELRTPLTSILGYVELLDDLPHDELSAQARRMLQVVGRNGHRELRLINDLLTVATGALGQMQLTLTPVDLVDLVARTVASYEDPAESLPSRVQYVGPRRPLVVSGDATRLAEAITSLIDNAVKFSGPADHVSVDVEALTDHVVVTVSDTGPGIHPDDQSKVFERLFRGRNALAAEAPGTGLGLTIVRAIVAAHHGTTALVSNAGSGTVASIQLPRTTTSQVATL